MMQLTRGGSVELEGYRLAEVLRCLMVQLVCWSFAWIEIFILAEQEGWIVTGHALCVVVDVVSRVRAPTDLVY